MLSLLETGNEIMTRFKIQLRSMIALYVIKLKAHTNVRIYRGHQGAIPPPTEKVPGIFQKKNVKEFFSQIISQKLLVYISRFCRFIICRRYQLVTKIRKQSVK